MLFDLNVILECVGVLMCIFGGLMCGKYKDWKTQAGAIISLVGMLLVFFT